jgi:hypothetical protein
VKLGSDLLLGMKRKNGFVPNVGSYFVFINKPAFLVGINGFKENNPTMTSLVFYSAALFNTSEFRR